MHSICQQIWKTQQWPQDWKRSVFIPISKKGNAKECSDYYTIALISHASKVMLKILQYRLQKRIKYSSLYDWKRSVFIPISKKCNAKECSNYCTIALISHASKVMLKILQARFQQHVNCELPDVQAGFRKGRGTKDQIANLQ